MNKEPTGAVAVLGVVLSAVASGLALYALHAEATLPTSLTSVLDSFGVPIVLVAAPIAFFSPFLQKRAVTRALACGGLVLIAADAGAYSVYAMVKYGDSFNMIMAGVCFSFALIGTLAIIAFLIASDSIRRTLDPQIESATE